MTRRPHLIDRFPPDHPSPEEEAQEDAQYPGGPLLKLAPHQAEEAREVAPRARGRTSASVVVTAVVAATFASIAFQLAPQLYGSPLLGGAAVWCGLTAGLIAAMETVRWWWRRPWRNRFAGVAWGLRLAWAGLAWLAVAAWTAAVARPRPEPVLPEAPGPPPAAPAWLTQPEPEPVPPPMAAGEPPAIAWPEAEPVYKIGPPAAGRPRPENRRVAEPSQPVAARAPAPKTPLRISSAHGTTTPGWDALITETGDWYADSDEEWLDRSRAHVLGMGQYAQALLDAYEAQVYETGVDPNALAGWLLFAEAAADSAETMADGRRWFVQYMAEYREAARQGKHPPKDQHWVTGEGEAD